MDRVQPPSFVRNTKKDPLYGRNSARHFPLLGIFLKCFPCQFKIAQYQITQQQRQFALQLEEWRLFLAVDEETLCQWIAECIAGVRNTKDVTYDVKNPWQYLRWLNPCAWLSYFLTVLDYRWQMYISRNQPPLIRNDVEVKQGCLSERLQKIFIGVLQLLLFGPLKMVLELFINTRYIGQYWQIGKQLTESQYQLTDISQVISGAGNIRPTTVEDPQVVQLREKLNQLLNPQNDESALEQLSEQQLKKLAQKVFSDNGPLEPATPEVIQARSRRESIRIFSRRQSILLAHADERESDKSNPLASRSAPPSPGLIEQRI